MGGNGLYDQNIRSGCCYSKENEFHFLGTNLSHYGSGWSHLRFFDSAVSCEAISGSAASSVCKCCKGTVSHGRLPVFYIVQTNFVNAQGESWTGEMDDRNRRVETHWKNAGVSCFTTPRLLFTDNQSSGFCTAFRTASSASGRPCKSLWFPFVGWYLTSEGCRETRHPNMLWLFSLFYFIRWKSISILNSELSENTKQPLSESNLGFSLCISRWWLGQRMIMFEESLFCESEKWAIWCASEISTLNSSKAFFPHNWQQPP